MKSLSAFAATVRSYPSRLCGRKKYKEVLCLWSDIGHAPKLQFTIRKDGLGLSAQAFFFYQEDLYTKEKEIGQG